MHVTYCVTWIYLSRYQAVRLCMNLVFECVLTCFFVGGWVLPELQQICVCNLDPVLIREAMYCLFWCDCDFLCGWPLGVFPHPPSTFQVCVWVKSFGPVWCTWAQTLSFHLASMGSLQSTWKARGEDSDIYLFWVLLNDLHWDMWYHRSFPFTVVATQLLHIALTSYGHAIGVWMHLASQKRVPLPCLLLRILPQRLGWIVYHSLNLIAVVSGQRVHVALPTLSRNCLSTDCWVATTRGPSLLGQFLGLWAASWLFQSWVQMDWYLWLLKELPAVLLGLWVGHQSIGFCVVLPVLICFLLLCGWHVPPCLSFVVDTVCETFVWCSASGIFVSSPDLWSVCPGQIQFGLVLPRVGGFGSLLLVPLCLHCYCGGDCFDPFGKFVNYHKAITIPPFGTR